MGWWQTRSGNVIGDPAADYVDQLVRSGLRCVDASELPCEVRKRLDRLYVEGIGRAPTDAELSDLLAFCGWGDS